MKRRLLLKLFNRLNRYHRHLPVRVQRWLWHAENRYVWDHVEIRLNGVPLKRGTEYEPDFLGRPFTFGVAPNPEDVITMEIQLRDDVAN